MVIEESQNQPHVEQQQPMDEDNNNNKHNNNTTTSHHPKIKFRNYRPRDKHLAKGIIQPKREHVSDHISELLQQTKGSIENVDLVPRKVNWDLKRDIKPKLNKLDHLTRKALIQLHKESMGDEESEESEYEYETDSADSESE
eukprot:gb/GECH01000763.1/.p1 GENE.gb/GECH01000763.1/~~gb/GECH01000763.1/.p1  ORF type:complete len:142 (+),score=57.54 gb/GECH01000763.1/:1-426(+)